MRIDQVHIDDYGPLETPPLEFSDGVEVVYGPNESGKTLLVDALLFMLTGQNDDDRVGQSPIGYVRVDEGDTIHRLDDGETVLDRLENRHEIVLGAREFRNTFVVRSADSELSNEDDYYDRATDVVSESLVEDIDRVQDAIQDRGRITPTGILIDQQDEIKTRTHHRTADGLKTEVEAYIEDARAEGVPSLEAELLETEKLVTQTRGEVERLEAAKRQREYEDHSSDRDDLKTALEELDKLPAENEVESFAADVKEAVEAADRVEAIRSRLEDAQINARRAVAATAVALLITLGIGSWVLSVLEPSLLGFVAVALAGVLVAAIPGALGVYFWQQRESAQTELAELQSDRTELFQRGRELGLDVDELYGLVRSVAKLQRRYDDLGTTATELHGELKGALGLESNTPEETLDQATSELKRRETDLDEGLDLEYTEGALKDAQAELDELEAHRDALSDQLEQERTEIQSYGDDIIDLPFTEYGLDPPRTDVKTLEGLEAIVERLTELIETIEVDADNARAAADVLDVLKEDEQSRVGELFFGAESRVTETFSRITDGRYESVRYDEGDNELWVETSGGLELKPNQLSQSTFDQLYFAVRLAFAQELLDDETGFLLLDDSFLAADGERLERQIEIVGEFAEDGWQVLYFTAKEFDRDQFVEVADATVHTLERFD